MSDPDDQKSDDAEAESKAARAERAAEFSSTLVKLVSVRP